MIIKSTDDDFNKVLEEHPKVIVKYYADWCGQCRLFSPKFIRLSDDEQYKDVAFVDVNAEKSPAARKAAGVDNLPFFAIFKNGQLVEGTATSREEKVLEMLQNLN